MSEGFTIKKNGKLLRFEDGMLKYWWSTQSQAESFAKAHQGENGMIYEVAIATDDPRRSSESGE